ncbi:transcriptional regulator, AlpA family [Rhizobiales bacterium GAS191]|nr:transcriptional regulator, AlpA family [Rhizobiales bacterium GAS191]
MSNLEGLPPEITRNRILDSRQASEFIGLSLPHFRRLYRARKVPSPILIGERKLGWRAGDLAAWLDAKSSEYSHVTA